ncbi:MAG: YhcH/YjgK/YiaL family protein [Candidatus Latescibacteria bacterium]|jgi:YhcH/YjgK/YiaL family protein|nr:YhcH/YjgK/YiaL family protein [Candidatus Latescibacterota bacterium]MEE3336934.1 YhcH/YjgK/YiaL family protein [Candidatus Latescibacterota bacterium]
MILDELTHAGLYHGIGLGFAQALEYLAETDLASMAPERYDLDGDNLFVMVQEYETKPKSEGFWEAHRAYADIQYVVHGDEHMGYAPTSSLKAGAYEADRDFLPLDGDGLFVPMTTGQFIILWPQDAHMPQMAVEAPAQVKKAVFKVKL